MAGLTPPKNEPTLSGKIRKRRAGAEDVEIGRKIRALRLERGLSQSGLADGIGLTFQQVQKYEKGTNRVSAGRLQQIADMLNTPVMFFYGGMGQRSKKSGTNNAGLELIQTRGAMRLLRSYSEISLKLHQVRACGSGGIAAQQGAGLSSSSTLHARACAGAISLRSHAACDSACCGCKPCRKSAARCACDAAVKIARLSDFRTLSQLPI